MTESWNHLLEHQRRHAAADDQNRQPSATLMICAEDIGCPIVRLNRLAALRLPV
jgi:hypothetical protein